MEVKIDKEKIAEVAKKHGLALLVLFGSRARGDERQKSDFDVAYSSVKNLSLHEENQMAVELHEVLKTINVDLVNLHHTGPLLLKKITEEGIPLYEIRQSVFNQLYLYALRIFRESKNLNILRQVYVLHTINQFKKDVVLNW